MCRRLSPTHNGHEYWCTWDGNIRQASWESREFLMKDPDAMGMVMELDERLDQELACLVWRVVLAVSVYLVGVAHQSTVGIG